MPEGLRIAQVEPGSPAAAAGAAAGERILCLQGEPVEDIIDFLFFSADPELQMELAGPDGTRREIRIANGEGLPLGITLEPGQFRLRTCANRCVFCFVDQMPPGFRPSLYVKDDDWRNSFLHGSYVTLTNMSEQDFIRIRERCISPLYVSVHATDDEVRAALLGTPRAKGIMPALKRLAAGGTRFHTQAVIVEGVNDGSVLERTIRDLASLHPYAQSLSVVPVGLTACRDGLPDIDPLRPQAAAAAVALVERLQAELLERLGTRFVFASDELYLQAGLPLPPADAYEDFCQLENGVGLVSDFEDAARAEMEMGGRPLPGPVLLVTGLGVLPRAADLASRLRRELGADIEVLGAENRTFGPSVNVTGLLTGADIASAVPFGAGGRTVLLPDVMFRDGAGVTLDNMTPEDISRRIGAPCRAVPTEGGAFVRSLLEPKGMGEDHV